MLLLHWTLDDWIILKLGDQVWFFGSNVLVFLLLAAVVGVLAESVLLLFLVRRFWPLLRLQGQPAQGVWLARSTAQEQGSTPLTGNTPAYQSPGSVPGFLPPRSSPPRNESG
jgi:hypothetical protein